MRIQFAILLCIVFLFSTRSFALDTEDFPLEIHGFMTSGLTKGDNKDVYSDGISRRPNFVYDSRFGLNISKRLSAKWDLSTQYISSFTRTGRIFDIDFAIASYYPIEGLALQVGKHKLPIWLISDHSGIGKVYPWVRPPQEVYVLDPVQRFNGMNATYEWNLRNANLALALYGGAVEGTQLTLAGSSLIRTAYNAYDMKGATLNTEYGPVLLRFSYLTAHLALTGSNYKIDKLAIFYKTAALKIDWSKFLVYAEFVQTASSIPPEEIDAADRAIATARTESEITSAMIQRQIVGSKFLDTTAYYGTLGYRIHEDFMLAFTYARLNSHKDMISHGSQNSQILGIKYEINKSADLKLEWQKTNLEKGSSGLYTQDVSVPTDALARHLNIFNFAVDFIF